jgi:sulfur carrier protein ThiS
MTYPPGASKGCAAAVPAERVGLNAGLEEHDLKGVLTDETTLADQLIQPLFNEHAIALAVDVRALRRARHEPVEEYVESCGGW